MFTGLTDLNITKRTYTLYICYMLSAKSLILKIKSGGAN